MTIQLTLSAETSAFLLARKSPLVKITFVRIDNKSGDIVLELQSENCETLAMGMFFAGQDKTMEMVKKLFKAEIL
jgi:hypothetical protein